MGKEILLTLAVIVTLYIGFSIFKSILKKFARLKEVPQKRIFYISKVFEILFVFVSIVLLFFIWSVDIKSVALFASSFFAIVGVALFAQWSILSNITASVIIFFNFPAKIGDNIKIIDGDNSVEGIIKEISLFQIEMSDVEGNTIFYPNNLLLQKPVVKLKKKELQNNS